MGGFWLKDTWKAGDRPSAGWANLLGHWFSRLKFWGPLGEERNESAWVLGHLQPKTTAEDPADCTVIGPYDPETQTVGEGAEAADTATAAPGDTIDTPIMLYGITRLGYYHAGDRKLYAYMRAVTFDPWGHLQAIGPEIRVEVDVTEHC